MRKLEIQKVYLQVQSSLGILIEEATDADKEKLRRISVQLVNVKRSMIGDYDEIKTDAVL